ncbi:hypothetical protein NQ166_01055 [Microbacterium sp. zg.Y1090]|uniref:hypothetical protein n=1 Tax=Microbacterium wangruii TaxID=3049073 RepID=UPI00214C3D53|nr:MULTISPECIES: hypothetical protein [unclassified Microbacterium]MCR2817416.1 hypothetical protein [Microbacterium sp. zg.Y1090]WIM29098.1 hypothetical protein QNO26_04155 [Microbacterium sp. zg-Y1090]
MALRANSLSRAGIVLANVALLALVTGCESAEPSEKRGPQPIIGWSNGGDVQSVVIGTCHGNPVATVEEDDETAIITVTSTLRSPGDACQDSLQIALDRDLGNRHVIDGVTGEPPPGIEG